jgi:hypothetical protein
MSEVITWTLLVEVGTSEAAFEPIADIPVVTTPTDGPLLVPLSEMKLASAKILPLLYTPATLEVPELPAPPTPVIEIPPPPVAAIVPKFKTPTALSPPLLKLAFPSMAMAPAVALLERITTFAPSLPMSTACP